MRWRPALPGRLAERWSRSLRFRVVLATLLGSTAVLVLLLPAFMARISAGILSAKEVSALAEATVARSEAQRLLDSATTGGLKLPASRRIDAVVAAMGARGAQAGLFEALVLSSEPRGLSDTPERGTNLVSETSVPAQLRGVVAGGQRQAWTYTTIRYTDGRTEPGFVVGAPLAVPGAGPYEFYQLFPLAEERATLDLIRTATLVAGLVVVVGLVGSAVAVTHWVVSPVHEAARTAKALSAGELDARIPIRGEDDLARLAVSFNDMAATLQKQIGEMEQMTRAQQRFVADVSHELRTPLTTVRMAADLLHEKRADMPTDDRRAVELLANQLDRFEALLSDLLETSRQDSGIVQLDYEDADLRELAERATAALRPLVDEAGCSVRVQGEPTLVVECDAPRVERIVANLLTNAIEHGQGRPIDVVLGREGLDAVVSVTDRGIGLTPEELDSVFTRFWRADPSRVRRLGGTGLGLSIALGDASAHGGSLTAQGRPGEGATFTLVLPVHRPAVGS